MVSEPLNTIKIINYFGCLNEKNAEVAKVSTAVKKLTAKFACTILTLALYECILQSFICRLLLKVFHMFLQVVYFSLLIMGYPLNKLFLLRHLGNITLTGMHYFSISAVVSGTNTIRNVTVSTFLSMQLILLFFFCDLFFFSASFLPLKTCYISVKALDWVIFTNLCSLTIYSQNLSLKCKQHIQLCDSINVMVRHNATSFFLRYIHLLIHSRNVLYPAACHCQGAKSLPSCCKYTLQRVMYQQRKQKEREKPQNHILISIEVFSVLSKGRIQI